MFKGSKSANRYSAAALRGAVALAALMVPIAANAQEAEPANSAGDPDTEFVNETVIVTGTRLTGGFDAPTPVTSTPAEDLKAAAPNNLADALNQLPVFADSLKTSNPGTTPGTGNSGQNLLNMRGLGPNRNLVLLNGNRFVSTNFTGSVDINVLPQALVKRVDVVTGGASAAYGSDAVSGVINFVLDEDFEGIKGDVRAGVSGHDDLPSFGGSLSFGKQFAQDRLHVLGSFEYFQQDGIRADESTDRDWFDRAAGQYPVPGAATSLTVVPDIRSSRGAYGGLIVSGPLAGTTFLPGGGLGTFDNGDYTSSAFQSGGDGPRVNIGFAPDQERYNGFLRAQYDFSNTLQAYIEGTYAHAHTNLGAFVLAHVGGSNTYTIFRDNAFLPADLAAAMDDNGLSSVRMTRFSNDFPLVEIENFSDVYRGAAGFRADLSGSWKMDGALSYGRTELELRENNLSINRNLYAALDAVDDGTGNIVCRSTLSGFDPGCAPLNPFGVGSPSQAAIDYVIGDGVAELTLEQTVASLNFAGDLGDSLSLGAGPISVATGMEYREEQAEQTTDPISQMTTTTTGILGAPAAQDGRPGGFLFYNPLPFSGSYNIKEAYLEIGVPILKNSPLGHSLSLNGAVRYADYSTVGNVVTWKWGGDYEPVEGIRFRGTTSRDIRAASLIELFDPGRQATLNSVYQGQTYQTRFFTSGNPDLDPEKADTLTYGVVFQPSFLPGFKFSADRFEIEINGAIDFLLPQQEIDLCEDGNQYFCTLITLNPDDTLTVVGPNLNLASQKVEGYDFEASYKRDLGNGVLGVRLLATNLTEAYIQPSGSSPIPYLGQPNSPDWSGNLQVKYEAENWSFMLQERYISESVFDAENVEGVDTNLNHTPAVWYTDATVTYDIQAYGETQQLFFSVNNLFDREPPIATSNPSSFSSPTSDAYDPVGRYFTAGVRFKF